MQGHVCFVSTCIANGARPLWFLYDIEICIEMDKTFDIASLIFTLYTRLGPDAVSGNVAARKIQRFHSVW